MSEQVQERSAHGVGEQDIQVVTMKEAARALGISESGVRKRLAKGTLHGTKDDRGLWVSVMLPVGVELPPDDDELAWDDEGTPGSSVRAGRNTPELLREIIQRQDRELVSRDRRIEFLEAQLQQRDAVYLESLRQLRALMPPEPTPEPAPAPEQTRRFLGFLWRMPV